MRLEEDLDDAGVEDIEEVAEALEDEEVELLEGIAAERAEVDPFAHLADFEEMVGPEAVEQRQSEHSLGLLQQRLAVSRRQLVPPLHRFGSIGEDAAGLAEKDLFPLRVDDAALAVEEEVVLQEVAADIEVLSFDDALGLLDLPGRSGLRLDDISQAVADHEVVIEGDEELRFAGIALAPGAAAELRIGAAAGHVRGDRHRTEVAGLGDDRGLELVVARVQDVAADAGSGEPRREMLRLLDRARADEDGAAGGMELRDLGDDRAPLRLLVERHDVGMIDADRREVGRDRGDAQSVGLVELRRLGGGGAGHAADARVERHEAADGERAEDRPFQRE